MKNIAIILCRSLGNKIICNKIEDIAKRTEGIRPLFINIYENEVSSDSLEIPIVFRKLSVALRTYYITKQKITHLQNVDAIFIVTLQPLLALSKIDLLKPLAICFDATSMNTFKNLNQSKNYIDRLLQIIINRIYRIKFNFVDIFMPLTFWCKSSLIDDYKIEVNKVELCYPGIDLKKWEPATIKKSSNELNVLFVGNDLPRKGILDFLDYYHNRGPIKNLLFTIVTREERSILFNKSYIKVIHNVDHDNLIDIYRNADIFLFPTKSDMLGLVLIEAAATGLPIIATKMAAIPEIVLDGKNGYLVDRENWAGFYERLMMLANDYEKIKLFGKESRKIAEDKFSHLEFESKIQKALYHLLQISHVNTSK